MKLQPQEFWRADLGQSLRWLGLRGVGSEGGV